MEEMFLAWAEDPVRMLWTAAACLFLLELAVLHKIRKLEKEGRARQSELSGKVQRLAAEQEELKKSLAEEEKSAPPAETDSAKQGDGEAEQLIDAVLTEVFS